MPKSYAGSNRLALQPYSPREKASILGASWKVSYLRQPDQWVAHLVHTLMYTGWHEAVIYDPNRFDPRVEGGFLCWTRPKNKLQLRLPIHKEIRPWIEEFLSQSRPGDPKRYYQILADVGFEAGLKCNNLRFRHTACVIFIRDLRLPPTDVMRLMGVTAATLQYYAIRPIEDIENDMRSAGW